MERTSRNEKSKDAALSSKNQKTKRIHDVGSMKWNFTREMVLHDLDRPVPDNQNGYDQGKSHGKPLSDETG
jgi:hypothetical protein